MHFSSSTSPVNKTKVLVIYSHLPHYRAPVFRHLVASKSYSYELYYSDNIVDTTIKSGDNIRSSYKVSISRFGPFLFQTGLIRTIVRGRYCTVILLGNPYILSMWLIAALARIRGRTVLFWTHGWLKEEKGLLARVRSIFYRLSHGLLLYGERAKAIGLGKNFAPNRLHVIYNSLDYDRQKQVRTQLEIAFPEPQSELYFLCIARLTPAIRLDLAITALRIVRETVGMQIPLVLIGEGEMRSPLEEAARNENVEVRFLGAIYEEEEIGRWIYRARAVVSPGKAGLTAMHGLAYGVPIITHGDFDTQMPEFEAICPGVTGDFFQAGNAEALAKVLADWAQKPRLPRERQAAVESIERRYTPERQVEFIEQALSSHESDSK